jgi:hypothetical protein
MAITGRVIKPGAGAGCNQIRNGIAPNANQAQTRPTFRHDHPDDKSGNINVNYRVAASGFLAAIDRM